MSGSLRNGNSRSRENQPTKRSRRNAKAYWNSFTGYGTRRRSLRNVPAATGTSVKTTDTNTAVFGGAYITKRQPGICVPGGYIENTRILFLNQFTHEVVNKCAVYSYLSNDFGKK